MTTVRKRHDAGFKKKVALEAIRQQKTVKQITSEYGVHATQVNQWKKQATDAIGQTFVEGKKRVERDFQQQIDELHRQLGQVISERDWLKKSLRPTPGSPASDRKRDKRMVQPSPALRAIGGESFRVLLSNAAGKRGEPAIHAIAG